jgi:hypothetical protein
VKCITQTGSFFADLRSILAGASNRLTRSGLVPLLSIQQQRGSSALRGLTRKRHVDDNRSDVLNFRKGDDGRA